MSGLKLLTAAVMTNYRRRKDRSLSLSFSTNEKTSHDVMTIDQMVDQYGYLYFRPEETVDQSEVEELDGLSTDLYDNPKTPSQRLRNTLYKVWETTGKKGEFKEFYRVHMERMITHYKSKIQ